MANYHCFNGSAAGMTFKHDNSIPTSLPTQTRDCNFVTCIDRIDFFLVRLDMSHKMGFCQNYILKQILIESGKCRFHHHICHIAPTFLILVELKINNKMLNSYIFVCID